MKTSLPPLSLVDACHGARYGTVRSAILSPVSTRSSSNSFTYKYLQLLKLLNLPVDISKWRKS